MPDRRSRFAVLVLTHGRPDRVETVAALRRAGYTGRTYFVVDDEDATVDEYRGNFGPEHVIVFSKTATEGTFDIADTETDRRAVVYARNAAFGIARDLGLEYFLTLDDDYNAFYYRFIDGEGIVRHRMMRSFNAIVDAMLAFLDETGAATVAFSQGGDHMGGAVRNVTVGLRRKAMNSFFFRTDRPVEFPGRLNEDTTAYVVHGGRGDLFFTVMGVQLNQMQTQSNPGGLTDLYLAYGTYVKSFYTVMQAPSCVYISTMGRKEQRAHHAFRHGYVVPKIISGRHRKPRPGLP